MNYQLCGAAVRDNVTDVLIATGPPGGVACHGAAAARKKASF